MLSASHFLVAFKGHHGKKKLHSTLVETTFFFNVERTFTERKMFSHSNHRLTCRIKYDFFFMGKGSLRSYTVEVQSGLLKIEPLLMVMEIPSRFFPRIWNAAIGRYRGQDNMAASAGRYYGEGGRATKRQKTEDGGMTTVSVSF